MAFYIVRIIVIKEVIIVEGNSDIAVVKRAVDAEIIATGGFTLRPHTVEKIKIAYEKRGIIIFTDPDGAGERIRRFLTKKFPFAKQAFVAKEDATKNNDVGIEQASIETIQKALAKVRVQTQTVKNEFVTGDLFFNGLAGDGDSAKRRNELGKLLGIGYTNAKQFLVRLNNYSVTRQEFEEGLAKLDENE